ncbi:protein QUIRKY [Phoenix dactylifera]|uniref:Protein QUIRKY n=1 Tax=Phoenix dactylifera TaxID=42345 RepID=A0A8B7BJV3_PHODC|nr:protein QUIRKY [Phoenix dactylifera]
MMAIPPSPTVRKLVVEVEDARGLLPKDGQGTSSPYVVVDFDGQRKRTRTVPRDLNPQWHERLEFVVVDPATMEAEELDVEVYNDKRLGNAAAGGRKNHFLGRVRIYGTQFCRQGEEGLIYFPLEKRNLLSWIRGEIGLKIYYYDEHLEEKQPEEQPSADTEQKTRDPPPPGEEPRDLPEVPAPTETAVETQSPPPPPVSVVVVEEDPPPPPAATVAHVQVGLVSPPATEETMEVYPPEVRKVQTSPCVPMGGMPRRSNSSGGDCAAAPRVISGRFVSSCDPVDRSQSSYDLVEPMQYLFVRVVKARGLRECACESPYVKVRTGSHAMRSKPARDGSGNPEWNQVFALSQAKPDSTLEISVWDGGPHEGFLGGVCFDLSDVPVRDQPDGPLAPQWYRLEGGDDRGGVTGDIMVAVWMGTQADDAFPESCNSDAPYVSYTRSKVYQSPKLWYLRVSVIEAQDLRIAAPPPGTPFDIRVKIQLGFQSARSRRSTVNSSSSVFSWPEDLMFVVSEPLDDEMIILVEDRSIKEVALLGHVIVPVGSVEQRLDERQLVASKWYNLEGGPSGYCGRVHLRLCLEGGYHVLDEAAHVCSDFRPTAKQLWKPPVGVLELGILGARGLLPMKTKGGAKGSTDAYCVAKYGKKWVRTRTITDSFDPRWNEQYTWQVYDPCTVLTIGVFDNWRMFADLVGDRPDYRIGKVRIRVSTLESNRVYTNSYPLLVLLRSGVKRMGEVQVAVRFACPALLPDTCAMYTQPMLPRMHYLRPIGVVQQEVLRVAAIKMVAGWMARSEPPLGPEVVRYMLDADAHTWSVRRSKANWFRIMGVIAWAVGLARWVDDVRRWRNPVTTVLVHVLYLVLVWYPELVVPTASLYVFLVGAWYYRFRPRTPAGMDMRLSQADTVDADELDEEFDTVPSAKPAEVVRVRYDRLRTLAARVQRVMGDFAAQGERVQALVSWRDPRATRLFIGVCLVVSLVLYVVPPKMVAVALGFYFLRHPMFRDPMPPASLNFFRRLPSLSDRLL